MKYFKENRLRISLLFLVANIIFHFYFLSTKSYTVTIGRDELNYKTEEQYQNVLNSISDTALKINFIQNTQIKYLVNATKEFEVIIYIIYFLIAALIIFPYKIGIKERD